MRLILISIFTLTSLFIVSCKTESKSQSKPAVSTITSVAKDTMEWQGHRRVNYTDVNVDGKPINFDLYSPGSETGKTPLVIAIHGATGKKEDWREIGGYTKGGDMVKALLNSGYSVIAVDLAYHGTHHLNTENWNWKNSISYDSIFTNHWEDFHAQSMKDIQPVIEFSKKCGKFDTTRIGMASYSLGGYFINQVAQRHGSVKSLIYMVPGTTMQPEYSAIRNQDGLSAANVYMIVGKNDEYIPYEASEEFFADLKMQNKTMKSYESGHSLPVDYVEPLTTWLKSNL